MTVTDLASWTFGDDGSATFTGPVSFPAGLDAATTKVAVIVLGPGGAAANFPAVLHGPPGESVIVDSYTTHQVAFGTTPPASVVTIVSPGGPGVAAHVTIDAYVNSGEKGDTGTPSVLGADDLTGTPVGGQVLAAVTPGSGDVVAVQFVTPKVGPIYSLPTISTTALSTSAQRALGSLTIPAQPWAWWPEVDGECVITNAIDTRVDLVARINSVSGDQVGYGHGAGAGAGPTTLGLHSAFGAALPGSGTDGMNGIGYGRVAAGAACTIFFRAENQVSSSNQWSTGAGSFKVKVAPVP
jgi:hypothetical protein